MDSGMLPAVKGGKKKSKLGWSYGTDHPKNEDKMTFKFVVIQVQIHQTPKVSHELGNVPYSKRVQKTVKIRLVVRDRPPRKTKKMTCKLVADQV